MRELWASLLEVLLELVDEVMLSVAAPEDSNSSITVSNCSIHNIK